MFTALLSAGLLLAPTPAAPPGLPTAQPIEGRALVVFAANADASDRSRALRATGAAVRRTLADGRVAVIADSDLKALRGRPEVRVAVPDVRVGAQVLGNDTYASLLWGLENVAQVIGPQTGIADADVDAGEAWGTTTGAGTVVAVIDTGFDATHPDLSSRLWSNPGETANGVDDDGNGRVDDLYGWDFVAGDAAPTDIQGHGTHVAGTIAAQRDNGIGVAGVAPDARIMALKALGDDGSGSFSNILAAMDYAGDEGADVVNLSLGGAIAPQDAAYYDQVVSAVMNDHPGVAYVMAAGNSATDNDTQPAFPCNASAANAICVAATDNRDAHASYSNRGATKVDLHAPGSYVASTVPGGYAYLSGTSMASPHAAGVAALVAANGPHLDGAGIASALRTGTDPLPGLTGLSVTGGRLNAMGALGSAAPLDTDPPDAPVILAGPSGSSPRTEHAFTFSAVPAGATRACALDGAPRSCATTLSVSGLADGAHEVTVTDTNAFGSTSAARAFTVVALPAPTVVADVAQAELDAPVVFTVGGLADGATATCRLDGGSAVACGAGARPAMTFASAGTHTLTVTQTLTGRSAQASASVEVVDTRPPATPQILTGPSGSSPRTAHAFTFSAPAGTSTRTCTLDGATRACPGSTLEVDGLADGAHVLTVTDTNDHGSASASRTFTVVPLPAPVGTASAPAVGLDEPVTFTVAGIATGATATCRVDGGAAVACGNGPRPVTSFASPGPHTLTVTQSLTGRTTQGSSTVTVLALPAPQFEEAPPARTYARTARFTLSAPGAGVLRVCRLDAAVRACPELAAGIGELADGEHVVDVTDSSAGGTVARTHRWEVLPLDAPSLLAPDRIAEGDPATATAGGVAGAALACTLDGAAVGCDAPVALDGLAVGDHELTAVQTVDGRTSPTARVVVTVLTPALDPPLILAAPPARTTSRTATVRLGDVPAGVARSCEVDGAPRDCTTTLTLTGLGVGEHLVVVTDRRRSAVATATAAWTVVARAPRIRRLDVSARMSRCARGARRCPVTFTVRYALDPRAEEDGRLTVAREDGSRWTTIRKRTLDRGSGARRVSFRLSLRADRYRVELRYPGMPEPVRLRIRVLRPR